MNMDDSKDKLYPQGNFVANFEGILQERIQGKYSIEKNGALQF